LILNHGIYQKFEVLFCGFKRGILNHFDFW